MSILFSNRPRALVLALSIPAALPALGQGTGRETAVQAGEIADIACSPHFGATRRRVSSGETDREVVAWIRALQTQAGSSAADRAFRSLQERYDPLVRKRLQKMNPQTIRREDLEDLHQDAWLRALKSIKSYDPRLARFSTWISKAAWLASSRAALLRKRQISVVPLLKLNDRDLSGQEWFENLPAPERIGSQAVAPDQAFFVGRYWSDLLLPIIEELSPEQKTAFTLVHLAGMPQSDVAADLGVTRQAISANLKAAERAIHARLTERGIQSPFEDPSVPEPTPPSEPTAPDPNETKSGKLLLPEILDSLPAEQRAAFVLVRFQGMRQAEAASQLGVTQKAISKRIGIAIRTIRTHLEELGIRSPFEDPTDPESAVLVSEEWIGLLRPLIEDLPGKQKAVFNLVRIEGLTQREAAARFGITQQAAFVDLKAAETAIRRKLAEKGIYPPLADPDLIPSGKAGPSP